MKPSHNTLNVWVNLDTDVTQLVYFLLFILVCLLMCFWYHLVHILVQNNNDDDNNNKNQQQQQQQQQQKKQQATTIHSREVTMVASAATIARYNSQFKAFMTFKNNINYNENHQWTQEERESVTPNDIIRFFKFKATGNANANDIDDTKQVRSDTILTYKASISYFMINRTMGWNEQRNEGNPTKSRVVKEYIERIEANQTCNKGKDPQHRREFTKNEFEQVLDLLVQSNKVEERYGVAGFFKFQYNLIARSDCISKMKYSSLLPNLSHPKFITAKISWSKTVKRDKAIPQQIVMGAIDSKYCALIGLAIHMECFRSKFGGPHGDFLFALAGVETGVPAASKTRARDGLKSALRNPNFVLEGENMLGTHSVRKFATSYARWCGCQEGDIHARGRWSNDKVIHRYISSTLPYPDAKIASVLCQGGACYYKIKEEAGINNEWIKNNVVPFSATKLHPTVALILGKALLWAIFDDNANKWVSETVKNRIKTAYSNLNNNLEEGSNPVERVRVIVSGGGGQLFISDFAAADGVNNNNTQANNQIGDHVATGIDHERFNIMYSLVRIFSELCTMSVITSVTHTLV